MKTYFDHEKLDVYRDSIAFCGWTGELLNSISAKAAAKDQLDRASTSSGGFPNEESSCAKRLKNMRPSTSTSTSTITKVDSDE